MEQRRKKLLLATGGSGGHLYPAQAIAGEIIKKLDDVEVLFAGAGLETNRYFDHKRFSFCQVTSSRIFQRNIWGLIRMPFRLAKGIYQALRLMRSFRPDLVVGFGSFHAAPIMLAAKWCGCQIVLFEANAVPGRVNRLFAKSAKWCAIYFPDAARSLKVKTYLTQMPFWRGGLKQGENVTCEQSRAYLGLNKEKKTLLVFGGSQGAASINEMVVEALTELSIDRSQIQVVHITGSTPVAHALRDVYARLHIEAMVKDFEHHMHLVWPGIDLAICRAGAGSIAEQINYEVPSILVPYPHASSQHQEVNGRFVAKVVKGAELVKENLDLKELLSHLLETDSARLAEMRSSIANYKNITKRHCLSQLILEELRCSATT